MLRSCSPAAHWNYSKYSKEIIMSTNQANDTDNLRFISSIADDDELEIDLMELLFELKKRLWLLILAAILGLLTGYGVSRFALTKTYTSTSTIYVMSKETTITSLTDLQIGSQLTADYKVLVSSRTVMENVINSLKLDMDYTELRQKITLSNPQNTRILTISVLDTAPGRAKAITDAVAEAASAYIADIMEQDPPKIIEYGELPLRKTGPKNTRNAIMCMLLTTALAAAGIAVSTISNDTIRTEDDIRDYFGLTVLAAIPEKDAAAAQKVINQHQKGDKRGRKH